jgi:hypothetical protein
VAEKRISTTDMGNELAGFIAQSAKGGGIASMSGAGLNPQGRYDQYGVKGPSRIVATTDFTTYESGQFGNINELTLARDNAGNIRYDAAGNPLRITLDPSRLRGSSYELGNEVYAALTSNNIAMKNAMIKRIADARGKKAFGDLTEIAKAAGVDGDVSRMIQGY